ncbi:hypothetical protein GQ53DRAFT_664950 [Thozetella sp. PMI_491]|nr:hypothetical protein GQ53DRAFT_664950 [Thozetella sp. PMI_491]
MKSFSTQNSVCWGDQPHELFWHPEFRPKTDWIKFQGRLYAPSQYRGTPEKSIDDAWARYTQSPWFDGGSVVLGVAEDDIRRSRKAGDDEWFNSTVRLDERNGGGHMATLEVFHQMHCLDEIRRYTYPEYYQRETGHHLREHVVSDHCIDMIRQVLMCHADTGLVVFHWTEERDAATPDFSTWHQCRNPEEILQWAREHEAPITHPIIKPHNAIMMPGLN